MLAKTTPKARPLADGDRRFYLIRLGQSIDEIHRGIGPLAEGLV